jgi:hypothetical protein
MNSNYVLPVLVLAMLSLSAAYAQHNLEQARQDWPDLRIFDPQKMRGLGVEVRNELSQRSCRIPQFSKWDGRHNVIRGSFVGPGSQDLAVLCLAGDNMSIIVFPDGKAEGAAEIRKFPANAYRMIHAVSPFVLKKKAIRDNVADRMPDFDHDAIEDGPVGERSETAYFNAGEWITVF